MFEGKLSEKINAVIAKITGEINVSLKRMIASANQEKEILGKSLKKDFIIVKESLLEYCSKPENVVKDERTTQTDLRSHFISQNHLASNDADREQKSKAINENKLVNDFFMDCSDQPTLIDIEEEDTQEIVDMEDMETNKSMKRETSEINNNVCNKQEGNDLAQIEDSDRYTKANTKDALEKEKDANSDETCENNDEAYKNNTQSFNDGDVVWSQWNHRWYAAKVYSYEKVPAHHREELDRLYKNSNPSNYYIVEFLGGHLFSKVHKSKVEHLSDKSSDKSRAKKDTKGYAAALEELKSKTKLAS